MVVIDLIVVVVAVVVVIVVVVIVFVVIVFVVFVVVVAVVVVVIHIYVFVYMWCVRPSSSLLSETTSNNIHHQPSRSAGNTGMPKQFHQPGRTISLVACFPHRWWDRGMKNRFTDTDAIIAISEEVPALLVSTIWHHEAFNVNIKISCTQNEYA